MEQYRFVIQSLIAGLLASLACGLGSLPLLIKTLDVEKKVGIGYGFAGGLMFSASVYNLLLPALNIGQSTINVSQVILTLIGVFSGAVFLWRIEIYLTPQRLANSIWRKIGARREILIFIAMCFHSIPEGVAVGVGYTSTEQIAPSEDLGHYIALAIAIHNIPEGLAVAIPMRAAGANIPKCFFFAFLTSLPQPLAAAPASLLVWFFKPLMTPFLGFAAGAMMFLVIVELIPDALAERTANEIAWSFIVGFGGMILIQAIL
jgi:ZIP family zinc transporter